MYHIAVVEDEKICSVQVQQFLDQYQEENNVRFKVTVFEAATQILESYEPLYDMILMDIDMPGINGMDAADQIRQTDQDVVIVFITNIASFAIRGYEVGAMDFVVKPITYYNFSTRLARALKRSRSREPRQIILTLADGVKKLEVGQIYYVEVQNRMLHYYTQEGVFAVRGTMQSVQQMLEAYSFAKCNHWYMVNLRHVSEVKKNTVVVGEYELEISRRNRTPFLKALTEYVGGYR
ncbi:MAG: response regulator transcription factor [Eubacterium sp.]|nr:response regulator transcription factor [Eubacterium sp.]